MGKRGVKPASPEELVVRFWSKVIKTDGCWLWTGSKNPHGYGGFRYCGRLIMAHRFAYEITYRALLPGEKACHRCDNPSCVRPDHLFAGTQADNLADCRRKGRNLTKVSDEDVVQIRKLYRPKIVPLSKLATTFGITREQVWHIVTGKQRREANVRAQ